MPERFSDFAIVHFQVELGDQASSDAHLPFVGNVVRRNFHISGFPTNQDGTSGGSGYLLIQIRGVDSNNHEIVINGHEQGGIDLPDTAGQFWETWLKPIRAPALQHGPNTIAIIRASGGDNFQVGVGVIHWRTFESDS